MKLYDYVKTDLIFEIVDKTYDREGNVMFTIEINGITIEGVYSESLRVVE